MHLLTRHSSSSFLIDELYGRNTSIEIKQIILASIILGVRELAGWTEDEKVKSRMYACLSRITHQKE